MFEKLSYTARRLSRYVQDGRDAINQIRRARRIKMYIGVSGAGEAGGKNNVVTSTVLGICSYT